MHYEELLEQYKEQVFSNDAGDHTDEYYEYIEYHEGSFSDYTSTHDAGGHHDNWDDDED